MSTLKIRAWCGAIFAAGFGYWAQVAPDLRCLLLFWFLAGFAVAFAAIATVTVA